MSARPHAGFCPLTENHVSSRTNPGHVGGSLVSTKGCRVTLVLIDVILLVTLVFFHLYKSDLHGAGRLLPVPSEMVMKLSFPLTCFHIKISHPTQAVAVSIDLTSDQVKRVEDGERK